VFREYYLHVDAAVLNNPEKMYVFLTSSNGMVVATTQDAAECFGKWIPVGAVIGSRPHLGRAPQRFGREQKSDDVCSMPDLYGQTKEAPVGFRPALFVL
jgi:hypothetical protein